jgi:hypothetical protein
MDHEAHTVRTTQSPLAMDEDRVRHPSFIKSTRVRRRPPATHAARPKRTSSGFLEQFRYTSTVDVYLVSSLLQMVSRWVRHQASCGRATASSRRIVGARRCSRRGVCALPIAAWACGEHRGLAASVGSRQAAAMARAAHSSSSMCCAAHERSLDRCGSLLGSPPSLLL